MDRDPRDIYILGKVKKRTQCYPVEDVKKFVNYYKQCWNNSSKNNTNEVLYLQFEDIVYNYIDSVKIIEAFLGISKHDNFMKYFNPEMSINNTQLKYRYPEMADEIAYIENELKGYLYKFPREIVPNGDFF